MESDRSQEIWEMGDPLFDELSHRMLSEVEASKPKTLPGMAGNIVAAFGCLYELVKPDSDCKVSIVRDIARLEFAATGRRKLPTESRSAVRIQAQDFELGDVSWAYNRVAIGQFLYDAVRLTRMSEIPSRLAVPHPNASERRAALSALITELYRTGVITSKANKTNVSLIQNEINGRQIRYGGTSDENIRRQLRYFFRGHI